MARSVMCSRMIVASSPAKHFLTKPFFQSTLRSAETWQPKPNKHAAVRRRAAMGRGGELLQGPLGDCRRVSRCSGMISFDVVGMASPDKQVQTITWWWSCAVAVVTHCCWCCCCCCCVAAAAAAVVSDAAAVHSREATVAAVQASWHCIQAQIGLKMAARVCSMCQVEHEMSLQGLKDQVP